MHDKSEDETCELPLKQDGIVVTMAGPKIDGVIILADESANWVVAGLRQLDRLALAVDEYAVAERSPGPIPVCVLWTSIQPEAKERFPQHGRLTHLSFTDDFRQFAAEKAGAGYFLVMNTRVVLRRNTLFSILRSGVGRTGPLRIVPGAELSPQAEERTMPLAEDGAAHGQWFYLHEKREIGATERQLFAGTGKSQDGLVSRFVNRPVSRLVSRWLVRSRVKPNQLTLLLTAIPVVGSLFLLRGDYLGFALGAFLFQVHSALDGCDGEIARVKYQDSAAGQRLDGLCDRISTLPFTRSLLASDYYAIPERAR